MKTTQTAKTYLVVALLLVGVAFVAWYMMLHYVLHEGALLGQETVLLAERSTHDQAYQNLKSEVAANATEQAALMSRVLTEDKTITFLTNIENDAAAHGVVLTTDSIQRHTGKGALDNMTISFSLTGAAVNVRQVITMLETLPYYGTVDQLVYTTSDPAQQNKTTAVLHVTLGLLKPTK